MTCYHLVIKVTEQVDTCESCGHDTVSRPVVCADCGKVVGAAIAGVRLGTYTRSLEASEIDDAAPPAVAMPAVPAPDPLMLPTIRTGDES